MEGDSGNNRGRLSECLAGMRRVRRLSQRQLAKLSGVSLATVRNIELGTQRNPKPETLRLLARGVVTPEDGEPATRDFWMAYVQLMRTAGYASGVEDVLGQFHEARISQQTIELFATLPGPTGEHSRFIDHLLKRVAHALLNVSTEDRVFLETQLLLFVERFAPGGVQDEEETGDEDGYPPPDVYLRKLMEMARTPFRPTPGEVVDDPDLYATPERLRRYADRLRRQRGGSGDTGGADIPASPSSGDKDDDGPH